ncbi:amidase family protein [Stachybotrys elegans]|uniref:Amidase family protein n=1 Tax=Stachybotrys elegans TaxID=80388 RepID=A0A8K0SFJ6_9HYPO|nr:amidase family protein [Stachybotrys elegans]
MIVSSWTIACLLALPVLVRAAPVTRNVLEKVHDSRQGAVIYELGEISYLANALYPKAVLNGTTIQSSPDFSPIAVIVANETTITGSYLESTIASYLAGDDVFSNDFLASLYLTSAVGKATIDRSGVDYLRSLELESLYLDSSVFGCKQLSNTKTYAVAGVSAENLPAGPYTAVTQDGALSLLSTYRLYRDEYRTFITGAYPTGNGEDSFTPLGYMDPRWWNPMIPVPSRIHYWNDSRPLAGVRVAIKDLFDMNGMQTSAGSQAWIRVTPIANSTAPAIQRLVDLGAALVGKYKLAQFASGANPWDWVDEQYPFNPRGDGYLTCSASSSGGGCSVAAYEWLDNAIGSDTGSSMRRPAAGLINLEGALPLSWSQDTAGVFGRDPLQWVKFAKAWYTPELHQEPNITGLTPLVVPDNNKFPKRIRYLTDYLPLANPAAEEILQDVLGKMTALFNMTVENMNLTSTVIGANIYPEKPANVSNWVYPRSRGNSYDQYTSVVRPLKTAWAALSGGRFPPVDPQWRSFVRMNDTQLDREEYNAGLRLKNQTVSWFEKEMLYETEDSCSESMFICDIGTGGLPSFREEDLNQGRNASFLAVRPPYAAITCANICPSFACADYTIPLGQVEYQSPVTFFPEKYPVTINMIVRRGCDFVLFNMIEKMAKAGILTTVKTGREAF